MLVQKFFKLCGLFGTMDAAPLSSWRAPLRASAPIVMQEDLFVQRRSKFPRESSVFFPTAGEPYWLYLGEQHQGEYVGTDALYLGMTRRPLFGVPAIANGGSRKVHVFAGFEQSGEIGLFYGMPIFEAGGLAYHNIAKRGELFSPEVVLGSRMKRAQEIRFVVDRIDALVAREPSVAQFFPDALRKYARRPSVQREWYGRPSTDSQLLEFKMPAF